METNIFEIFKMLSKEYEVEHLAKALMNSVEAIGYPPQRLRVFTSKKAYLNNAEGVKSKNECEIIYEDDTKFNVKYGNIPYFYTYTEKIKSKPEDTYNSIYLGVGYSSNSFNRFKILKRGTYNKVSFVVYVVPSSAKCLRIGIIGHWSKNDLELFKPPTESSFFAEPKKESDLNG